MGLMGLIGLMGQAAPQQEIGGDFASVGQGFGLFVKTTPNPGVYSVAQAGGQGRGRDMVRARSRSLSSGRGSTDYRVRDDPREERHLDGPDASHYLQLLDLQQKQFNLERIDLSAQKAMSQAQINGIKIQQQKSELLARIAILEQGVM